MKWRVIGTDSESETGVAPICENIAHPPDHDSWVFDCCPHPHLELGTPSQARRIARELTDAEADVCN